MCHKSPIPTPGPWAVHVDGDTTKILAAPREPYGYPIEVADLSFGDTSPGARALNARLIAAAPEVYAALSDLVWCIEHGEPLALGQAALALARVRGP